MSASFNPRQRNTYLQLVRPTTAQCVENKILCSILIVVKYKISKFITQTIPVL